MGRFNCTILILSVSLALASVGNARFGSPDNVLPRPPHAAGNAHRKDGERDDTGTQPLLFRGIVRLDAPPTLARGFFLALPKTILTCRGSPPRPRPPARDHARGVHADAGQALGAPGEVHRRDVSAGGKARQGGRGLVRRPRSRHARQHQRHPRRRGAPPQGRRRRGSTRRRRHQRRRERRAFPSSPAGRLPPLPNPRGSARLTPRITHPPGCPRRRRPTDAALLATALVPEIEHIVAEALAKSLASPVNTVKVRVKSVRSTRV